MSRRGWKIANFTVLYFSTLCIVFTALYAVQLDLGVSGFSISKIIARIAFFDRFFIEALVCLLLCLWLSPLRLPFRLTAYLIAAIYVFTNLIQLSSLYAGNEFLSSLAVENAHHIILGPLGSIAGVALLGLAVVAVYIALAEFKTQKCFRPGQLVLLSLFIGAAIVPLRYSGGLLPKKAKALRAAYFRKNSIGHTSPIHSLYEVLFVGDETSSSEFTERDREEAKQLGFNLKGKDARYPLVKDTLYNTPLPFKRSEEYITKPNVILFLIEGFSARMTNLYGAPFKGLSPNIDRFAREALVVKNYFNHTAATYRGLHGQMCSLYPKHGGIGGWHTNYAEVPKVNYHCLPDLLNQEGYQTVYWDCHKKGAAHVGDLMQQSGFDQVWQAERMSSELLGGQAPLRHESTTDHQLVRALINFLKNRESYLDKNRPFFLMLYNHETHAFQDRSADGIEYGDGKNTVLNKFHNLDDVIGIFWEYFKNSEYADNTIFVLSADHAHYPEPQYIEVAGQGYQKIFVDRIPLVIYDPTHELPKEYDARYSTSINFAPSLSHLLELPNQPNPFLGNSIFDETARLSEELGVASIGSDHFLVTPRKIHVLNSRKDSRQGRRKEQLGQIKRIMEYTRSLEDSDSIWPAD